MRVHEPDLAPEEGAGLRSLEALRHAAAIRQRPVEQARAIGREQVAADQIDVVLRLLAGEEIREDRVDHREQAVADARLAVARVQQVTDAPVLAEVREPGDDAVRDEQALEVLADAGELRLQLAGRAAAAGAPQRRRQRRQRLMMERDRPGAAEALGEGGVDGLERVVPVAVAVGGEAGARDHAPRDHAERALHVREQRRPLRARVALRAEEVHSLVEDSRVVRGEQILRERQQRPEDDVAVRVAGSDAALALEEHEPLRPVAVGILVAEDAQQELAHGLEAAEREQQLDRPLAHVARAPAAARILLEPARREVVDQRVVGEPRQDLRQRPEAGRRRCVRGRVQVERARHARPEALRRRGVLRRERAHVGRGGLHRRLAEEAARDAQPERPGRGAHQDQEGLPSRTSVCEEQLVAADALEGVAGGGIEAEAALRKAPTQIGVGQKAPPRRPERRARSARGRTRDPSSPFTARWFEIRKRRGGPARTSTASHISWQPTGAQLRTWSAPPRVR